MCATDAERLDVFNGLLLAPNLDAAFDAGLISFSDERAILISATLGDDTRTLLGLSPALRLSALTDRHQGYLGWHRSSLFQP